MIDDSEPPVPTRAGRRARGRWVVRIADEPRLWIATDLGPGGLFVADLVDRPVESRVALELHLEDGRLDAEAVVRWVRARRIGAGLLPGCGLAFQDLSDHDRRRIAASTEAP